MKKILGLLAMSILVLFPPLVTAEGLLPSIESLYGVGMPSLFDSVKRFPDVTIENSDGSVTEQYNDISDNEYQAFGNLLGKKGCEMLNYSTEQSTFVATVAYNGATFSFSYDITSHIAKVNYPAGTYNESLNRIENYYLKMVDYTQAKDYMNACKMYSMIYKYDYKDTKLFGEKIRSNFPSGLVSGELFDYYILHQDGTVSSTSLEKLESVSEWNQIISIDAGSSHILGLKADGTVVASGQNDHQQCEVTKWKNIIAVSGGSFHSLGLKSDGTVVAVGKGKFVDKNGQCNVAGWKNIIAISAGNVHSLGLKADGTVVAVGSNSSKQCNVNSWKDIIAISAGDSHSVGLKRDGTVVAVGDNSDKQCNVSGWKNIVQVVAGTNWTIGLQADGKVLYTGYPRDIFECNDAVSVTGSGNYGVLIRVDGKIQPVEAGIYLFKELRIFNLFE